MTLSAHKVVCVRKKKKTKSQAGGYFAVNDVANFGCIFFDLDFDFDLFFCESLEIVVFFFFHSFYFWMTPPAFYFV